MALTISLQWRRIKQQKKLISDFNEKGFREVMGYGKVYRRRYIFVNTENAGDNGTRNSVAENYDDNGVDLDPEKTIGTGASGIILGQNWNYACLWSPGVVFIVVALITVPMHGMKSEEVKEN